MSIEADILNTRAWLAEHRRFVDRALYCQRCAVDEDVLQGYDANIDGLKACAEQAKELETLVKQAHELLSGEWDPDDVDRHKFLVRLERAIP